MKKRIIILLVVINFLLMVTVPIANAIENKQDELKLTFKEAVFLALRNNAKIKSAEVGRISQKYAVVVAKHSFQPNYSLHSSYQYYSSTVHKNRYAKDAFDIQPKVSLLTPYGTEFGLSMNNPIDKERDGRKGWEYTPSLTFEITQLDCPRFTGRNFT